MRKQTTYFIKVYDLDFLGVQDLEEQFQKLSKIFSEDTQDDNKEFQENGWYFKIETHPTELPDWFKEIGDEDCTVIETAGYGDFLVKFVHKGIRVFGLV